VERTVKAAFDTNILIDYLNGISAARTEFDLYDEKLISIITLIEVLVGVTDPNEETEIRRFLSTFSILELSLPIANKAVKLRQELRLKVPDAIVYATARNSGCILVTRNTKDMKAEWPDIRVPYSL
jgi:predicted nucleic acid-binding protein